MKMKKTGIDISHWQKSVDFAAIKELTNIEFIILKAGGSDKGRYIDRTFYERYLHCKQLEIPVGCYYFVGSKCDSIADGYADAVAFMDIIRGLQFEYPVYIDFEAPPPTNKIGNTSACIAFCETMEHAGWYTGIYASDVSGFKDRLDMTRLTSFDKWVARYGKEPEIVRNYGMWQYTSKGTFDCISGNVDMDVCYRDYPLIMRRRHLNGF